jgi:hypothetical protein
MAPGFSKVIEIHDRLQKRAAFAKLKTNRQQREPRHLPMGIWLHICSYFCPIGEALRPVIEPLLRAGAAEQRWTLPPPAKLDPLSVPREYDDVWWDVIQDEQWRPDEEGWIVGFNFKRGWRVRCELCNGHDDHGADRCYCYGHSETFVCHVHIGTEKQIIVPWASDIEALPMPWPYNGSLMCTIDKIYRSKCVDSGIY